MRVEQFKLLEQRALKENYFKKQNAILENVCSDLTADQRRIVEGIYNDARPVIEAALTADQITGLFQGAEKAANDSGTNRTALGKSKDVLDAGNKMINDAGKWLQDTAPVKAFDNKYEQIKRDLKTKLGTSAAGKKTLAAVEALGDYAKANPAKTAFAIGILTAVAAVATGPVGGAIAGQVLRGANELVKGEKLSTAIGKGAKAAALGYLAGSAFKFISDEVIANIESAGMSDIEGMEAALGDANVADAVTGVTDSFGNDAVQQVMDSSRYTTSGSVNGFYYNYDVILSPESRATFDALSQAMSGDSFTPEWYKATAEFHDFMTGVQNGPDQANMRAIADAIEAARDSRDLTIGQLDQIIGEYDSLEDTVEALSGAAGPTAAIVQAAVQQADSLKATSDRSSPPKEIEQGNEPPESMNPNQGEEDIDKVAVRGTESQIRELLVNASYLTEKAQLDELSLAAIQQKAGQIAQKGMQKAADIGKNMTNRVTANKLQKAWEKAGKPEDSAEVMKVLSGAGVSNDVATQAFKAAKIEVPPMPKEPDPEGDPNIDVDAIVTWFKKQEKAVKDEIVKLVKQKSGEIDALTQGGAPA